MNAFHRRKGTRWGRALVLPVVLLAACTESPPDGDVAAPAVAVDVEVADCADVPFRDPEAFGIRLGNWGLAYGRLCPVSRDALTSCFRLADAPPAEIPACLRANAENDPDCPEEMRDALLDVIADMERADACRAIHVDLSGQAIAAGLEAFGDLPQVDLDDIATECLDNHPLDPGAAGRCAVEEAEEWRVELEIQRRAAAAHEAFDAVVAAADLGYGTWFANDLRWHCFADYGDDPASDPVACAKTAVAGVAAQREAVAALPGERHYDAIDRCVKAGLAVVRKPPIADAACLREDVAAYAEIVGDYAEHLEACGGDRRRYTDALDCAKARWLTPERIAAAKAGIFERHLPRTEPERVRDVIVRDCGRGDDAASFVEGDDTFLPGEHPRDIVGRRIVPCVESQAAAFAAIRRFAGGTHAAALDRCIERRTNKRFGWRSVADCVRSAARRAGDASFADALGACTGSGGSVDELVNCRDVPER